MQPSVPPGRGTQVLVKASLVGQQSSTKGLVARLLERGQPAVQVRSYTQFLVYQMSIQLSFVDPSLAAC